MTLPIPTRIRAVRENPEAPFAELYPETRTELAIIFASRSTSTKTTKEKPMTMQNFTGYNEHASIAGAEKTHFNGINASSDPARLIDVLAGLGLCDYALVPSLKKITASGGSVKEFLQVNVHKLDQVLRGSDASLENRMGFKASLAHAGLLAEPVSLHNQRMAQRR
jgi:hypothetical protein